MTTGERNALLPSNTAAANGCRTQVAAHRRCEPHGTRNIIIAKRR
jgi:hypothetical protein